MVLKNKLIYTLAGSLIALLVIFSAQSCETISNGLPDITVSRDTVLFDTVFTQMGSSTQNFKIRNNSDHTIVLSKVYIPGGNNSAYRFNVNGYVGPVVEDIEIEAGDSLYVFVEVTLDPNGGNSPLIHEDSLVVEYEQTYTRAMLIAFGQDAIYYYPTDTFSSGLAYSVITANTTWTAAKPIVIVGYLVVDSAYTLTIQPGTQIHLYSNGALWIYRYGCIKVLGEQHSPVVFQGTRLDYAYRDVPGQWDRILINEGSTENIIRHAVIKNGGIGVQLDDVAAMNTTPVLSNPKKLVMENVKIQNMSALGIFSRQYNIEGYNVLVTNCGQYCTAFTYGGDIKFYQSTFANYWTGNIRNFPTLFFNNYFIGSSSTIVTDLNFEFYNGIVYGSTTNEVGFDSITQPGVTYKFKFDHSLLRLKSTLNTSDGNRYVNIVKNADPKFTNSYLGDYTLDDGSAALNIGSANTVANKPAQLTFDLKGANRLISGNPDAGVFEK